MIRLSGIRLPPGYTDDQLRDTAAGLLGLPPAAVTAVRLHKRSVDARHKRSVMFQITVNLRIDGDERAAVRAARNAGQDAALADDQPYPLPAVLPTRKVPDTRPIVVGSGPAGLFAALVLARAGARPVLLERGRPVRERQLDVRGLLTEGRLDPESNVQFGEGGAGTFSDGKLTTGIKNPRCRFVLEQFVACGAPDSILWQAKPHVGTDNLYRVVKNMREEIQRHGGTVLFGHKAADLHIEDGRLRGLSIMTPDGLRERGADRVILAVGHSARDTLEMLHRRKVPMEAKPFAVGLRIEHPRAMIDETQHGPFGGHPALGAADYKLSCHVSGGRGAYTFCMCPGGVVLAAASETGRLVVNGMSDYARAADNSNSALLVGVGPEDFAAYGNGPLAGVAFQRRLEEDAFRLGGGGYRAPVQLVGDFLAGRASTGLGDIQPSYRPGTAFADLRDCLPPAVAQTLALALPVFGRRLEGFDRPDAVLTGVESRSSSPVRLLRGEDAQSAVKGLYPCGEGAGYAGGILSAAVDGIFCAENLLESL